jgi:hypothetical protein
MLLRPVLLLNFFVVLVMLSIGLRVSGGELLDVLRNRVHEASTPFEGTLV